VVLLAESQLMFSGINTQPNLLPGSGKRPGCAIPQRVSSKPTIAESIDAFAQTIIQNADAVVPAGSNSTQTAYLTSLGMSPTNVMTVVANGNLDISNWSHDGYGLLLVTGTLPTTRIRVGMDHSGDRPKAS